MTDKLRGTRVFGTCIRWGALAALVLVAVVGATAGSQAVDLRGARPAAVVALRNTTPPVVSGTTSVGSTLTTTNGAWAGNPTGFAYTWQRCVAAASQCSDIAGATAQTYQVAAADLGKYVRATVTASRPDSSKSKASKSVGPVANPPQNTVPPKITGTVQVGSTLTTSKGTWIGATSYAYAWQSCDSSGTSCTDLGVNATKYKVAPGDVGRRLRSSVRATNPSGSTVAYADQTIVVPVLLPVCASASVTWTGAGDHHNWSDSNNWSTGLVPGAQDMVCIPAGNPRVDVNTSVNVRWLIANRGLNITNHVTVTDPAATSQLNASSTWASGRMRGIVKIKATAKVTIGVASNVHLGAGSQLTNAGTIHFDGNNVFAPVLAFDCAAATNPATLHNQGTIELGVDTYVTAYGCTSPADLPVLTNAGTIIGATGGHAAFDIALDNAGVVDAGNGELYVTGSKTGVPIRGVWRAPQGGTNVFRPSTAMTFDGATIQNLAKFESYLATNSTGAITLAAGAKLSHTAGPLAATITGPGTLEIAGGTFDADITAVGPRVLRTGTWTGTHTIVPGAVLTIHTNASAHLGAGSQLTNAGTIHFDGNGVFTPELYFDCAAGADPATLHNQGTIELGIATSIFPNGCTGTANIPVLVNAETIQVAADHAGSHIGVAVDNTGVVDAGSGYVLITTDKPGVPIRGVWRATQTGLNWFQPGQPMTFDGATIQDQAKFESYAATNSTGTITVTTGASLRHTRGPLAATITGPGTLDIDGGAFDAGFTAGGPRKLRTGEWTGTNTIHPGAVVTIPTNGAAHLAAGSQLTNNGTIHFEGVGSFEPDLYFDCAAGANPATLHNNGTIELVDGNIFSNGCTVPETSPALTNDATFETSGGLSFVAVAIHNTSSGTIDIAPWSTIQLSSAPVTNDGVIRFSDDAQSLGCSPCDITNNIGGVIEVWQGWDLEFRGHFDNQGLFIFRGSSPRGLHVDDGEEDVNLGNGELQLDVPSWAQWVMGLTTPAPPQLALPPFTVTGYPVELITGACAFGDLGLDEIGFNLSACTLSHFGGFGHPLPDENRYVGTFGTGTVFNASASLGVTVIYGPSIHSIEDLGGWSLCFEASAGIDPFSGSVMVCKYILNDAVFPLGGEDIMMDYVETGPGAYTITGNFGLGLGPSTPFGASLSFLYTAVSDTL